ncbi:glycosyl hydrolase family 18 protein [Chitinophaga sp. sic0106]|uniref:glycosyl hydrolase family 18 protein n=1 Tax=Chitinophaga sp. sic0106 TaxID=2854785 RepID=UPI001C439C68|nr:glycosyl hydrolase family 18 protein [Chitinophaga sp. sic0106]MBV7529673.1 hypothetical protein [Chitinophaga sp. sic0106]
MKTKLLFSVAFSLLVLACNKQQQLFNTDKPSAARTELLSAPAGFKIIAYLPKYTTTLADHINAFDFTKVTHINIAFFNPDVNGNFPASQGTGLDTIVSKAHANNVKVLLSLGGGSNQSQYANLLTSANRAAFINKVIALVSLYNVDGIDVDLEGDNIDTNYEAFVTGLSAQLKPNGKLLTAAVAWWTRSRITDSCLAAFDFINVMAYDMAGSEHSPYSYATQHLNYWTGDRGLAASKVVIGVPFYGYYPNGTAQGEMKFSQIVSAYPGSEWKDTTRRTDGNVVNYNGITTIQNKTALAAEKAGGIMFWQVLQDASGSLSLLQAITDKLSSNNGWNDPYVTWKYDLGSTATVTYGDSTAIRQSVSVKGTPGFLPAPYYGYSRVFLPANSGGYFQTQPGTTPKVKLAASSTSTPAKFSWYAIDPAKAVTTLSFTLALDAANTNGQLIIPFGYSTTSSTTFNNTNQLTGVNTPGVFGTMRLDFYGGTNATLSYRTNTYSYTTINNTVFNKVGTYVVQIYCNNGTNSTVYTKNGTSFSLGVQTYHIWVNNVQMQTSAAVSNFPATGELATGTALNSFSINASGNTSPTPNTLMATLSDINMAYRLKD